MFGRKLQLVRNVKGSLKKNLRGGRNESTSKGVVLERGKQNNEPGPLTTLRKRKVGKKKLGG